MKKVIIISLLVISFSCKTNMSNPPNNIMSEDEMVNFLLDVNIINSSRAFRNISEINYYNIKDVETNHLVHIMLNKISKYIVFPFVYNKLLLYSFKFFIFTYSLFCEAK